MKIQLCLQKL
ncbi:hypothetical protein [Plasmodium yoelii yoelii]|uniref:Uncharacterized protein n=1 Tax=Plasmodium yoelii yoelii TaxID=73239 RepID=Q7RE56_PLAYO|nr:hypothetical protein [Plasmodium yoelii yoelii]